MQNASLLASLLLLAGCVAADTRDHAATTSARPRAAAATAPVGACPFATRGWQATLVPAEAGKEAKVAINGETLPDKSGRRPMIWTLGERTPPALVIDLQSDPAVEPMADRGWMWAGGVFEAYRPTYTHVSVRCANVEIARVPIRPEP